MKERYRMMKRYSKICSVALTMAILTGICGCNDNTQTDNSTTTVQMTKEQSSSITETAIEEESTVEEISKETSSTVTEETFFAEATSDLRPEDKWDHTNCHSGVPSTIEFTNADETGFDFHMEIYYFANSAVVDGRAVFISENEAAYPQTVDGDAVPGGFIYFTFDGETVHVQGDGIYGEGAGALPHLSGDYTTDEPEYLNADIVAQTYSEHELSNISSVLTEEENKLFIEDTQSGLIIISDITLDDGSTGRYIKSMFPGIADMKGYQLIITDDGMIYYQNCTGTFATNDETYTEKELPEYEIKNI